MNAYTIVAIVLVVTGNRGSGLWPVQLHNGIARGQAGPDRADCQGKEDPSTFPSGPAREPCWLARDCWSCRA